MIHRDLKPGNILMKVDGLGLKVEGKSSSNLQPSTLNPQPFLTDFSLAKRESGEITMTVEGQILGTPAYMSPEQARGHGHQADRRSDIYSLGVILFELLTGELPFRGETRMLIVQILRDEPPSPRKLNARIPRDLETITLKCLSKDPARRYAIAAEVAADLQRHLRGEPILARPISATERCFRWCRRNSALALTTATIALMLVGGVTVMSFLAIRANNNERRAKTALITYRFLSIATELRNRRQSLETEESKRFLTESQEEVEFSVRWLERHASDNEPELKLLLYLGRDSLLQMLKSPRAVLSNREKLLEDVARRLQQLTITTKL